MYTIRTATCVLHTVQKQSEPLDLPHNIEKCADTDYYGILGFPTDGNNVDTDIRTQRHIRLTQLMHPDKSEEEFKTRASGAIQSKRESYGMLDFAEF